MPREISQFTEIVATLAVLAVLAVGGYFGWQHFKASGEPTPVEVPVAAAPAAPVAPAPVPEPAAPPAIEHPVEEMAAPDPGVAASLPSLADSDKEVNQLLVALLSRKEVLGFLQTDGFVRRVVATVDNLPRSHAPVMAWPVNPTPQRFTTRKAEGGSETIDPDNGRRYLPLIKMIESVDTDRAVDMYRSLYPLFQQAYEELGFPGRYFNDRLVAVLDHLIATPVRSEPPAVVLVDVKGPVPSVRPWVRYEFADPALEAESAGRKILMRVGPDNQRRLQAKLKAIRERVARP